MKQVDFNQLQGVINGKVTELAFKPDELRDFMADKTTEQKRLARDHLKMVRYLKRSGK